MALTRDAFLMLLPYLKGARVLSLGYPDLLLSLSEATKALGAEPQRASGENAAAHKFGHSIPETTSAFELAGASSVRYVDIRPSRGCEEVVDLNYSHDLGAYDLVLDAGTIEHCANIGRALLNAAEAVVAGGHIFHSPPLSMINHGFYNVCPTLLYDFYSQNGWEVKHLSAFDLRTFEAIEVPPTRRFALAREAALYFLAQRPNHYGSFTWPIQTKYRSTA